MIDLAQLAANIDRAPEPLPWIVRNSDWIACALCVLIFLFAGHFSGEF